MMTLALAAALLLPVVTAYLILAGLWPGRVVRHADRSLRLFLAVGLGLGASSAGYLLWLVAIGPSRGLFVLEAVLLAGLLALAAYRVRRRGAHPQAEPPGRRPGGGRSWVSLTLAACFGAALVSSLSFYAALSRAYPHGRWDALTIWNLRARFLFRGGDHWRDAFSESLGEFSQPDYPLLVPGAIARAWEFIGSDSALVPVAVAMLFTFATVGLLMSSLSILRDRGQGLLAGIVLLGTVALVWQGSTQYADVPLAFFMLATCVAIALSHRAPDGGLRFLLLAGVMVGLAAWTKNEGLLFTVALFAGHFTVVSRCRGLRAAVRRSGVILVGAAPMLVLIVWFKTGIAPTNDMLESFDPRAVAAHFADLGRWGSVLASFGGRLMRLGGWLVSLPLALALYLLAVGLRVEEKDRLGIGVLSLVMALVLVSYVLVLLATPYNLDWHLETSVHRLILHIWPSLLFIYLMVARTPGEVTTRPLGPFSREAAVPGLAGQLTAGAADRE